MAENNKFTVAFEIGSEQITGIAGRKTSDGGMHVLAVESRDSGDCVRGGVIYNLDKTSGLLKEIFESLEKDLNARIEKVYVGLGGRSVSTSIRPKLMNFEKETKISIEMVDSLKDANRDEPVKGRDILDVIPQEYKIDNNLLTEPVGVQAYKLEANFLNISARPVLRDNIRRTFSDAGIKIADTVVAPAALAEIVLTPDEKRMGCALIDMGADTTTVIVYSDNILRFISVIPIGGHNITRDICYENIIEEDAEYLKCHYGDAVYYFEDENNKLSSRDADETYSAGDRATIRQSVLNEIIDARVREIIYNVYEQITVSGFMQKVKSGGLVLTGGCSRLTGIDQAFVGITGIDEVRVAYDAGKKVGGAGDCLPDILQAVAIMAMGRDDSRLREPEKETPLKTGTLFGEAGEPIGTGEIEMPSRPIREEMPHSEERPRPEKKVERDEPDVSGRERYDKLVVKIKKCIKEKKHKEAKKMIGEAADLNIPGTNSELEGLKKQVPTSGFFNKARNLFDDLIDVDN